MERDEEGMSSGFKFWSIIMEYNVYQNDLTYLLKNIMLLMHVDDDQLYTSL